MPVLEIILAVLVLTFVTVIAVRMGRRPVGDTIDDLRRANKALVAETTELKDRLEVLERLATDEDRLLARDIRNLARKDDRDQPGAN